MEISKEIENKFKDFIIYCKKHNIKIGGCGCCNSPWVDIDNVEVCRNFDIDNYDRNGDEKEDIWYF